MCSVEDFRRAAVSMARRSPNAVQAGAAVTRSPAGRARVIVPFALAALVAAVLAVGSAAPADAGSLPSIIAFTDTGGIWTVLPGNVGSEKGFYVGSVGGPKWSPNGQTLAFVADFQTSAGPGTKIVIVNRSGKVIDILLVTPYNIKAGLGGPIAWSPDGKRIAYICSHWTGQIDATGRYYYVEDVCVVDIATGAHRVLATHTADLGIINHNNLSSGCVCTMSWSPNGNEIAVDIVVTSTARHEIGIIDVAKGTLTQLTDFGALDPAFSPDGHEIAFVDYHQRIDIMSASGGGVRHVVPAPPPSYLVETPAWSPDGKELVYAWSAPPANNGNQDLFTVSVHGGHSTQETNTPGYSQNPSWAPAVTLCTVPTLKGLTLSAGKALLKRAGCVLGSIGGPTSNRGGRLIVTQSPGANGNVPTGTKVNVKVR
jgi:dipeptidyl aminopeptidase/acylaminoacyl peptidase